MSAIVLKWKLGAGASSYEVWRATTNSSGAASLLAADVVGNTYTDTTAVEGTTYYYFVKSVGPSGTSGFSASSGAMTTGKTLARPANVLATLNGIGEIVLTWDAVAGATKYDVYRHTSDSFGAATKIYDDVTATTYTDSSPTADDTLQVYWIVAQDGSGHSSDPSLAAGGLAAPPTPSAPTGFSASDSAYAEIDLAWTASAHATVYDIYRNTTNNSATATKIAETTGTSYADGTVLWSTTYYYWIKARNYTGTSAFSTGDSGYALPPPPPSAPTGVSASDGLSGYVEITWTPVSGSDIGYKVYRNTSNTTVGATLISGSLTLTDPSFVDDSMTSEAVYWYFVKAEGLGGASGFSSGDSGYADFPAPDAPYPISASDGNFGATTITWSPVTGATSYAVYRSPNSDFSSPTLLASGLTGTSYDDTTGTSEVVYYYAMKATGPGGTSGFGYVDDGYRFYAAPDAPTGVTASTSDGPPIQIFWDTAAGFPGSYSVWRSTTNNSATATQIASGITDQVYYDTTATAGVVYYYWVKATNIVGTSGFSTSDAGSYTYADVDGVSQSGGDAGLDVTYYMAAGVLHYEFDAQTIMDRLQIYHSGFLVADTGCIAGTASSNIGPLSAGTVRVVVIPNCDGVSSGTGWSLSLSY